MLIIKNTLDGYLRNVEILGNTTQHKTNLLDIRSVGDKVAGQELYNISIQVDNGAGVSEVVEILSPVQLEKVGSVTDRIICKDGVWGVEKNIGTIIFDGSESWNYSPSLSDDSSMFCYVSNSNIKHLTPSNKVLSNRFIYNSTCDVSGNYGIRVNSASGVQFRISKSILPDASLNGVKSWLGANNLNLIYKLESIQFISLPHDQQVKLRTFAGQTNVQFLTEIPGQIKAQVPKSLGAVVNTHTEQIANLNNEFARVKKLEESTVSTVETESNFTTIEETTNGYFEGIKLEGKTLVNLFDYKKLQNMNTDNRICQTIEHGIRCNNKSFYYVDPRYLGNIIVEPNTTYTFKCNFKNIQNSNGSNISIGYVDSNGRYMKDICSYPALDKNTIVFTTDLLGTNGYVGIGFRFLRVQAIKDVELIAEYTNMVLLKGDYTNNSLEYFEGLKSAGQDVEGVSVGSINNNETQSNKKPLLYYNPITETWEKPILRKWDSIEKHTDGKYYYHQRSIEENYVSGDENVTDYITDMTKTVKHISSEKIYECTDIDLITYSGETNYIINSGAITPKSILKVHNNISNVIKILQEKVSLLENTFIAGLKSVLSGDMYSLATILYPEDFEQNDNTEQDIMVIPE